MSLEIFDCCDETTEWIFKYNNDQVICICKTHFSELAFRVNVKNIINYKTKKSYKPSEIFEEESL